jgi:hypothetical protein
VHKTRKIPVEDRILIRSDGSWYSTHHVEAKTWVLYDFPVESYLLQQKAPSEGADFLAKVLETFVARVGEKITAAEWSSMGNEVIWQRGFYLAGCTDEIEGLDLGLREERREAFRDEFAARFDHKKKYEITGHHLLKEEQDHLHELGAHPADSNAKNRSVWIMEIYVDISRQEWEKELKELNEQQRREKKKLLAKEKDEQGQDKPCQAQIWYEQLMERESGDDADARRRNVNRDILARGPGFQKLEALANKILGASKWEPHVPSMSKLGPFSPT